jgi:dephospho-CoA kinase
MPTVIGLTGLASCGKGTVSDYLKKYGFIKLVFSDILKEEAERRGLLKNKTYEEQKKVFSELGDELRKESGKWYVLAEMLVKKIKSNNLEKVVVDGFRSVEEVEFFKKSFKNFYLIFVDADENTRFERRKLEDPNSKIENFRERDKIDIKEKGLGKVIKMADFKVNNNKDINYVYKQTDEILEKIH